MDSATLSTLRIALHGRRTGGRDPDWEAYGAFSTRATAMGWLSSGEGGGRRLWETVDADDAPEEGILASYEVSFDYRLSVHEPLTLIPFVRCAIDATDRLGKMCLDGAEITLPLSAMRMPSDRRCPRQQAVASLLATAQWYEKPSGVEKVSAAYSLTTSNSSDGCNVTPWLLGLQQDVAEFVPIRECSHPTQGGKKTEGMCNLTDWSAELIGWTAAIIAEAARQNSGSGSAVLTIFRASRED